MILDWLRTWYKWCVGGAPVNKDAALCALLETELKLLDRTITMQQDRAEFSPQTFRSTLSDITPPQHLVWALAVTWSAEEIESVLRPGFHVDPMPHRAMWLKFQMDFPIAHLPYRYVQRRGLFRTMPGMTTRDGAAAIEAVYYTFVPIASLRKADQG
jgi:hypothetical protein